MHRARPLIAGGGPAGCAVAIALARAGVRALLVERRRDGAGSTVCGGFLSWDTLAALDRLGVSAGALGARPIGRVRVVVGERSVEARLPARAAGLSRHALDAALLARAAAEGVEIERGVAVRCQGETVLLDGAERTPDVLFVATGKHALSGAPRGPTGGSVGLRATLPHDPALAGMIELHLFRGGYAGLLLDEDGTNLCLSVAPERLREAGSPAALVAELTAEVPRLGERIGGSMPARWVSIAAVPYGWRATGSLPGRYRVGDQAAVIASLAGDGMGLALASGRAAAEAWLTGVSGPRFQRRFALTALAPVALAEGLRKVAERPRWAGALLPLMDRMPGALSLAARLTRIA